MRVIGIPRKIAGIRFTLLSPDEIRKMSAVKIITPDTYDEDGFPYEKGLMDLHLGVIEPGLRCQTCGKKVDECPGHFGHIDLAMPVIHVGYVSMIKDSLRTTCQECGGFLLSEKRKEEYLQALINYRESGRKSVGIARIHSAIVGEASKNTVCPNCGIKQEKVMLDKPTTFRMGSTKLTPREVREWLERMPDEDLPLLKISPTAARPEWAVLTVLPVPSVSVRPSITLESGDRSEDDLTHKLVDVIKINQRLQENRDTGAPQLIVEDLWQLLQYHVTTYFDNQTAGIPPARHRSGRPLKTLSQRLKGKEGRFRSNLSGKRVNFSSRTVISPDPYISINEVGIPWKVARELTVPIRVTNHNIEILRQMVLDGPVPEAPGYKAGVNYVIRVDGRRVRVTDKNAETVAEALSLGSIVERQLQDGDIVLFNRQPSLHRMSMMAHNVRVMPFHTFRLNLPDCPPYNADFDGDEMNLHVVQSEEARAEAMILMRVQENVLSPRFGGSVIGAIHDHISGGFLLTHGDQRFTKSEVIYLLTPIEYDREWLPPNVDDDGNEYWTGKQVISMVLPEGLNLRFRSSICENCDVCKEDDCEFDAFVVIVNGTVLIGTIDEKSIGAFKGAILDRIARKYGPDRVRHFLDNVTRLSIRAIMLKGFTTGIDDEDIPLEAKAQIGTTLDEATKDVERLVKAYEVNELQPLPGRSIDETLEVEAMRILGKARDTAGRIAGRHLGLDNSAVIMARCGARGSMLNLSQMAASLGQQAVRGERIQRGYKGRTISHFQWNDLGAEAKGFVESSYKKGLTPTEYFFHSMGGREGLVDTAVRTSRSGYMQRRLINALEDLKVNHDRSVINTAGVVIQSKYGEDGTDPSRSMGGEAVNIDLAIDTIMGGGD